MKKIIRITIQVVHILSFCGAIFACVLAAVYEIIGPVYFEKILSIIGISNGSEWFKVICVIILLLMIITYYIKAKLFTKKDKGGQGDGSLVTFPDK